MNEHDRPRTRRTMGLTPPHLIKPNQFKAISLAAGKTPRPESPRSTPAFSGAMPTPEPTSDFAPSERKLTHRGVGEGDAGLPPVQAFSKSAETDPIEPVREVVELLPSVAERAAKLNADLPDIVAALLDDHPDDGPDAPIESKPGGGWSEEDPGDAEEFRQIDEFLTAFSSPIDLGLGKVTAEEVDEMIFVEFFNRLRDSSHRDMIEKGFWDDPLAAKSRAALQALSKIPASTRSNEEVVAVEMLADIAARVSERPPRDVLAALMLMVTELAEAAEGFRKDGFDAPDDKVPEFTALEAELADVILRICDLAGGFNLRVAEALVAKKAFNRTRERLHGKTC